MVLISGHTTSALSPEKLWRLLRSADVLERNIPGCQTVEEAEPGLYRGIIRLGHGLVKGKLRGEVRVHDIDVSQQCRVEWRAKGFAGSLGGFTDVRFAQVDGQEGTLVSYTGEVKPRGLFRAVPPGVFEDAVRTFTDQFFSDLSRE